MLSFGGFQASSPGAVVRSPSDFRQSSTTTTLVETPTSQSESSIEGNPANPRLLKDRLPLAVRISGLRNVISAENQHTFSHVMKVDPDTRLDNLGHLLHKEQPS
jgi:hypothetical protein